MDWRGMAYRKILREFRRYRRKMLFSSSKEEIWEACGRIHFYCCVKEYFQYNTEISEGYLCLMLEMAEPIDSMWRFYLKNEDADYLTWEGPDRLLERMLLEWKRPAVG